MTDYKQLAVRYLKGNKKRTILTVMGATIAVIGLFVLLNLGWSFLLHKREQIREQDDYEFVLFTKSEEQAKQILADSRVKNAYLGSYYDAGTVPFQNGRTVANALYVNTVNPYRMEAVLEDMEHAYGIEGKLNKELAYCYLNGGNANEVILFLFLLLMLTFIFAILGVGIVRNSIQLSMLEQIKDFGNLRCIGASKGELKTFIYMEGAVMELSGMILGILFGTLISTVIGYMLKIKAGFHIVPVVPIAIAFLGDLYFVMQENCKVISHMSPVAALRGEFRIRQEKIKIRKSRIFGKLFGMDGDYAYKNLMRNPGRFIRTVFALATGIVLFMLGSGVNELVVDLMRDATESYGYYQIYFDVRFAPWNTREEVQKEFPPMDNLEGLAGAQGVTEVKRLYSSWIMLAGEDLSDHFMVKSALRQNLKHSAISDMFISHAECYGYDEKAYERYRDVLVDGTLDISDHGIVLVNRLMPPDEEDGTVSFALKGKEATDYEVGDTIKIVNMLRLREEIQNEIEKWKVQHPKDAITSSENSQKKVLESDTGFVDEEDDAATREQESDYKGALEDATYQIASRCWQQLVKEGEYETYTIEGIVEEEVNYPMSLSWEPYFILPLEHYFALTGTDESQNNGMLFHVEHYPWNDNLDKYNYFDGYGDYHYSGYGGLMEIMKTIRLVIMVGLSIVLFILSMCSVNIMNTAASNLQIRKKEFAQLRVIGVSKKRLVRIVLLEGVIAAFVANLIGIGIGGGITYLLSRFLNRMLGIRYHFPVWTTVLSIVLSLTLLCGSLYFPLKGLKQDIASDLAASGE